MSITYTITEDDLKKAIEFWLVQKHSVPIDAKILVYLTHSISGYREEQIAYGASALVEPRVKESSIMGAKQIVAESDGKFVSSKPYGGQCRKCKKENTVTCQEWDSSCGGYTDYKMTCSACSYVWWHEGSDS